MSTLARYATALSGSHSTRIRSFASSIFVCTKPSKAAASCLFRRFIFTLWSPSSLAPNYVGSKYFQKRPPNIQLLRDAELTIWDLYPSSPAFATGAFWASRSLSPETSSPYLGETGTGQLSFLVFRNAEKRLQSRLVLLHPHLKPAFH